VKTMSASESPKPWATAYDWHGEPSGVLMGDTEGLRRLRDLIDEALERGRASVGPNLEFDFSAIEISTSRPQETESHSALKEGLVKFGCLAFLVCVTGLIVVGAFRVMQLLTR
jgi:hypothetical protein